MHKRINVEKVKQDFPLLTNGKKIIYIDNAATSQTPKQVTDAMDAYYTKFNANIHRGVYKISEIATQRYEQAHQKVAEFIHCKPEEVIFTRNATEALNLVAYAYGMEHVLAGDNVVVSIMEHHSNFVPWQQLCMMKKAELRVVDVNDHGEVDMDQLNNFVDERTKIVSITQMSNVFGNTVDVKEIANIAHSKNAVAIVDAAQSAAHIPIDFVNLGCDFLAFSGHKMVGPTGIGVLVGRKELLERMQPFMFGGDMIKSVSIEKTEWNELPWKFEAGTPNIAGGIGLGAAVDYLRKIGMDAIAAHEKELGAYALEKLSELKGITIYGGMQPRGTISFNVEGSQKSVISGTSKSSDFEHQNSQSFNTPKSHRDFEGVHAHDVATILDSVGVCVRAGHHCCQPLMKKLGVPATARISLYFYNDKNDVDAFIEGLKKVRQVFAQ